MSSNQQLRIRKMILTDMHAVLELRNKDYVRNSMLSQNVISKAQHGVWFSAVLQDSTKLYFIFEINGVPSGVVGFFNVIEGEMADWSFYIGTSDAPKGSGTRMCLLGLSYIFENTGITGLKTIVLEQNKASRKLHEKLGFRKIGTRGMNSQLIFQIDKCDWENTHEKAVIF